MLNEAKISRPSMIMMASTFGLCVLTLAIVSVRTVHAQSADLVLCDRIAADPSDPDKPADVKGVAEIAPSDIATAIKFCQRASAAARPPFYHVGRAYAANRQMPEAVGVYRKAAEKGSSAAMVEL